MKNCEPPELGEPVLAIESVPGSFEILAANLRQGARHSRLEPRHALLRGWGGPGGLLGGERGLGVAHLWWRMVGAAHSSLMLPPPERFSVAPVTRFLYVPTGRLREG